VKYPNRGCPLLIVEPSIEAAQRLAVVADESAMHSSQGIALTDTDDLELICASCANTLPPGALRARMCSICGQPCDVDARGLADATAIVNLRGLIASRVKELDAAILELERSARPPLWNLPLVGIHLTGRLIQWQTSQSGERRSMARFMRLEGPLHAPLYADPAALHEQRLLHALIAWSVEVCIQVYGKRTEAATKRGTIVFAITITAITLVIETFTDYIPQAFSWVIGLIILGIAVGSLRATAISILGRVPAGSKRCSDRLRRELSAVGLRCKRERLRRVAMLWLQARWAGDFDRDELNRGEATMLLSGGADAQGKPSEAILYVRGGIACSDVVVYLPMIDVDGAIDEPAEIARTSALKHLADLRRHGWMIEEGSAGIYATRFIDDAEALTSADWRALAVDIGGLLELPAGLGLLSSHSARAHLATGGVSLI